MLLILSKNHKISVDFYCPYPIRKFKKVHRINYIYIPFQKITAFRYLSYAFKVARLMKRNGPYDIIHSANGGTLFLKRIDLETFYHYESFNLNDIMSSFSYLLYRFNLHRSRHIIAISNPAALELQEKEKIKKPFITNANIPIDCTIFHPGYNFSTLRSKYVTEHDEVLLLCVGVLLPRKNPQLAIQTLKYLLQKGVKAKLIMIGSGILENYLDKLAKRLKVDDRTYFLKYVPEVFPYYSIADLLLIPSHKEGFGLFYLEGPACGVKFVGFNTGIASIATRLNLGTIVLNDKEFLEKALEMSTHIVHVGKDDFKKIDAQFSMSSFQKRIELIYELIIKQIHDRSK